MTETEAYNKLTAYCAQAEHCRAEVAEKLQRWGIAYEAIDRIADRLTQEGYIDEERYCRAFVRDKYRLDKWGRAKIIQALQLKKMAPTFYLPILNEEINREEYISILRGLLSSKRKSVHAEDEAQLREKLIRFALSRGFEMRDIIDCLKGSGE